MKMNPITIFYTHLLTMIIFQTFLIPSSCQQTITFSSTQVTSRSSSSSCTSSTSVNGGPYTTRSCSPGTRQNIYNRSTYSSPILDDSKSTTAAADNTQNRNGTSPDQTPPTTSPVEDLTPANGTSQVQTHGSSLVSDIRPANGTTQVRTPVSFPANGTGDGLAPVTPETAPPVDNDHNTQIVTLAKGSRKKPSALQKIVIAMTVCIVAMVAISFMAIYFVRKWNSRRVLDMKCDQNLESFLENNECQAPKRYSYSEIKKMTKNFSEKLGRGGFGSVFKGTLPDGRTTVAVKVLTEKTSDDGEEFNNEVTSISRTSHVNVVQLLGFCYERKKRALVYEFMANKSLDKFINNNGDCQLDWKILYKIAIGVARGLEYLHRGCNTKIVHFDIKPQNILLDHEFWPKISDFGLAKRCKKKQSILTSAIGPRGTVGFIAPELLNRQFGKISNRSDVYSYGMMILGIAGAKSNLGNETIGSGESEKYFSDLIYEQIVPSETSCRDLENVMNQEEQEITRKMLMVGVWCIQAIPLHRPTMSRVVEMLEGSLQSVPVPPKPSLEVSWEDQSVGNVTELNEKLSLAGTNIAS